MFNLGSDLRVVKEAFGIGLLPAQKQERAQEYQNTKLRMKDALVAWKAAAIVIGAPVAVLAVKGVIVGGIAVTIARCTLGGG